jgi:hypothetical protein
MLMKTAAVSVFVCVPEVTCAIYFVVTVGDTGGGVCWFDVNPAGKEVQE